MKKPRQEKGSRTIRKSEEPMLSGRLATEFIQFMEYHPAKDLRRNLRKMLLEFLMHESSLESVYLKDLLYDLDGLFDLIDAIEFQAEEKNG